MATDAEKLDLAKRWAAGEMSLSEAAGRYGVSRQAVQQWIAAVAPGARAERAETVRRRREERTRLRAAQAAAEAESAARDAEADDRRCVVCHGPNSRSAKTCSSGCADLWKIVRRHLDADAQLEHRRAKAHWILANPEGQSASELDFARRVLAGQVSEPSAPWRPRGKAVLAALREVERLRSSSAVG